MKFLLSAAVMLIAPTLVIAQTQSAAAAAKPGTKTAEKSSTKSQAAARRSALKVVEEVTPIDEDPNIKLTAEDIAVAKRIYVGIIPCELGAKVLITANEKRPGFFVVETKSQRFSMHPVESRTGAIRLEDPKAGALWLQLGNKSMLMSQKLGQRLADECTSPAQITFADDMKKNPSVSLLDAPLPPSRVIPVSRPDDVQPV
ncbi:MAG: hypothetical protein H7224_00995, partial [Polaromonas sp.]|nr:hypothetical protein [Polaromonas sp.]